MNVSETVKSIIVNQLGLESSMVSLDESLVKDLGADSIDILEIIMALEDKFNVQISSEQDSKFQSINDIVEYISTLFENCKTV